MIKILYTFFVILFFGLILLFYNASRSLYKYFGRPNYSYEQKIQIQKNYSKLIDEFGAKEISIKTKDSLELSGLLILKENAKYNILLCHGYRLSKEFMTDYIKIFPNENILLFDFRAHGDSPGKKVSFGKNETKDVEAALKILNKINNLPIIGIGISMGANALLKASDKNPSVKALILDSMFLKLQNNTLCNLMKKNHIPSFVIKIILWSYSINLQVRGLDKPILLIHSSDDNLVSIDDVKQFYRKLNVKKDLFIVDDARHGFVYEEVPELYKEKVLSFVTEVAE